MLLNKDIAQKLVDNIMESLGHNINIMNENGIIIASGSLERIGTYHQIAAEAIRQRERIDIYEGNISEYIGVKEGINMPFYFHNKIAGVIGITGNPKQIENTAMLVKMTAELMMEQEFLKERTQSHQSNKTFFVNKLLTVKEADDILDVYQWGLQLGYDLSLKRIACVFMIKNLVKQSKSPVNIDILKSDIIDIIKKSTYHTKQDISSYIDVNKILVLKTINLSSEKSISDQIIDYLEPIQKTIKEKYEIGSIIGIGSYREDLLNLRESFIEARSMVEYAEKTNSIDGYFFINDFILEYYFYKIPKKHHDHFFSKYKLELEDKPEIIETIHSMVKNNMSISDASKELFIHRNTVLFRLNKVKELFDIDPLHNDKDRVLLKLIDLYIDLSS